MPAAEDGVGVGVKLVALTPENPARGLPFIHASYVLFDAETQAPVAVLDGAALTALRTAAVSARDAVPGSSGCGPAGDLRRGRPGGSASGRDARRPADRARHGRVAVQGSRRGARGASRLGGTPWSTRTSLTRISSARARRRPSRSSTARSPPAVPRQRDRLVPAAHPSWTPRRSVEDGSSWSPGTSRWPRPGTC